MKKYLLLLLVLLFTSNNPLITKNLDNTTPRSIKSMLKTTPYEFLYYELVGENCISKFPDDFHNAGMKEAGQKLLLKMNKLKENRGQAPGVQTTMEKFLGALYKSDMKETSREFFLIINKLKENRSQAPGVQDKFLDDLYKSGMKEASRKLFFIINKINKNGFQEPSVRTTVGKLLDDFYKNYKFGMKKANQRFHLPIIDERCLARRFPINHKPLLARYNERK